MGLVLVVCPVAGHAGTLPCNNQDRDRLDRSLAQIRQRIDPCGESPLIAELLAKVQRCQVTYTICADYDSSINSFYRPPDDASGPQPRTISWNPRLRTQLESSCDGDPNHPVLRDPTASLLHELAHAAQDCDGLDPAEHEFEAVRIENIYRRAHGLCQRSAYGDTPLPVAFVKTCAPGHCGCAAPQDPAAVQIISAPAAAASGVQAGDADAAATPDNR